MATFAYRVADDLYVMALEACSDEATAAEAAGSGALRWTNAQTSVELLHEGLSASVASGAEHAFVLAVVFGAAVYFAQTASANSAVTRAGDYIIFTGQVDNGTDMLYVIDVAEGKMNAYELAPSNNTGSMVLRDQINLQQVFANK